MNPFELLNLLLRLALSAVMLASGLGKFHDPEGTRQAVRDFGCPASWTRRVARALPALEIVLSGLLLIDATSGSATVALSLLLAVFCASMSRLLLQKKAPPCHCFGTLHSKPVTRATLARTLVLLGLSVLCGGLPTHSITGTWPRLTGTALGFGWMGTAMNRLAGAMRRRRPATRLRVGQRLPAIRSARGQWLDQLLAKDRPTMLLFTSASCPPCQDMEADVRYWAEALREKLHLVRLTTSLEATEELVPLSEEDLGLLDTPTPGAILVDPSGTIRIPAVSKRESIEAVMRTVVNTSQ
ncbi:DoxX family membrane protein [bacterium]|nr:DoxX family membrane protein [bacterium]